MGSKPEAEKEATASNASRACWDTLSPEELSTEMKWCAAKRKTNRQHATQSATGASRNTAALNYCSV